MWSCNWNKETFFSIFFLKTFYSFVLKFVLPLPLTFFSLKAGPHTLFLSMFHSPTLGHAFPFCKTTLSHRTHIHSLGSIVKKNPPVSSLPYTHFHSFSIWSGNNVCVALWCFSFFVSFPSISCSPPSHFLSLLQLLSISPGFW